LANSTGSRVRLQSKDACIAIPDDVLSHADPNVINMVADSGAYSFKILRTEKYHVDQRLGFFGYYSYLQTARFPASVD
jgi:hypothetical protein